MSQLFPVTVGENPARLAVHFSAITDEWRTPAAVFEGLDAEFSFDHDPCPYSGGTPSADGLTGEWGRSNFVNPPYSNIGAWMTKALAEWRKGKTVVVLVPSRTDTAWWHEAAMQASEIRFFRGRLRFGDATNGAPFPSCLVIFRGVA